MICNMCPRHKTCADAKNGCEKCDIGRALHEERKKYLEVKKDFHILAKSVCVFHHNNYVDYDFSKLDSKDLAYYFSQSMKKLFAVSFKITCFDTNNKVIYELNSDLLSDSRFYIRGEDLLDVSDYYLPMIIFNHYLDILPSNHSTHIDITGIIEV